MNILKKTMAEMPKSFTSFEFNRRAVKNGYPERKLKNKGLASFISIYADNITPRGKTWVKKDVNVNLSNSIILSTEQQAIKYLKSKGYKVMKPVNEWVEC